MNKRKQQDKILFRYVIYTIYGWFLFFTLISAVFVIFIITLPFMLLFDKDRVFFSYLVKWFAQMFFFFYYTEWLTYEGNGLKPPKKGEKRIYVINHASQFDVVLMYMLPGPIKFLFKKKWAKKPLIGWVARLGKNLIVDEEMTAAELLLVFRGAEHYLENKIPFVIYPEGTRSHSGKIEKFALGSFKLALENGADIVPVVFDSWNAIRPGGLWIRDQYTRVRVLDTIKYEEFAHLNFGKVAHLVRLKMIQGLLDLRDDRRRTEKDYYRKIPKFEAVDDEMRAEVKEMEEYCKKKNIFLKSEEPKQE